MSPLISNLVCRSLDNELMAFAKKHRLRYSRYADDITFSVSRLPVPKEVLQLNAGQLLPGAELSAIIEKHEFKINLSKVKYRTLDRRQEVTGLTVNEFPNVPRHFVRGIEGALYAWEHHGYPAAQAMYEEKYANVSGVHLKNVLRGRIAYVRMIRGPNDYIVRRLSK